ncbi:MAG: O-antigen ligase family protein [Chloroflexi bacterium]|nr:O-antigen ligase family protein [Chloroflexota bacterium]
MTVAIESVVVPRAAAGASVTLCIVLAARFDALLLMVGAGAVVLLLVLSLRWPALPLLVVAAIIPFDEIVRLGELGTVGRTAVILFALSYAIPRLGRLRLGTIPLSGFAYIGWALLSTVWAISLETAWTALSTLVQLFALAVLVADVVVHQPGVVPPVLWVYSVSAAMLALIGVEEFFSATVEGAQRAAALADQNPAQFGTVLLPAFFFGVDRVFHRRGFLPGAAVALATGAGIVVSGTRGVWISVVLVTALFVLPRLRPRQMAFAVASLVVTFVAALQLPSVREFVSLRAETALSSGGAGRTDIWAVGGQIIASSPVVGSGFGNFPEAFTSYAVEMAGIGLNIGAGRGPHNIVIGTLGELGIFGLLALVLFLGPMLLRPGWGPEGQVVQASLVSLMCSALFLDILSNRKQVWLMIGLAIALSYLRQQRASKERSFRTAVRSPVSTRLGRP